MEISSVEFATVLSLEKESLQESCGMRKKMSFWPISIDGKIILEKEYQPKVH